MRWRFSCCCSGVVGLCTYSGGGSGDGDGGTDNYCVAGLPGEGPQDNRFYISATRGIWLLCGSLGRLREGSGAG